MDGIWLQEVRLLSGDGRASLELRLHDVESILPNFRANLAKMIPSYVTKPNSVQISIMLEQTRGDVLTKIVNYIAGVNAVHEAPGGMTSWKQEFYSTMSDELLNDVHNEVRKRNLATGKSTPPLMWMFERSLQFQREKRRP